jgi:hypothetical protein
MRRYTKSFEIPKMKISFLSNPLILFNRAFILQQTYKQWAIYEAQTWQVLFFKGWIDKIKLLRKTVEISYIDNTTGTHGDIIVCKHSDQNKETNYLTRNPMKRLSLNPPQF